MEKANLWMDKIIFQMDSSGYLTPLISHCEYIFLKKETNKNKILTPKFDSENSHCITTGQSGHWSPSLNPVIPVFFLLEKKVLSVADEALIFHIDFSLHRIL